MQTTVKWLVTVKGYGGKNVPHIVKLNCYSTSHGVALAARAENRESEAIVEYEGLVQAVLPRLEGDTA